ncbi:MAG: ABC transporter ATP-binding protein [Candidatus Bathyarchaeota archaeon]|nr:MAG: ABC transporter ATP-binding protein [Candidatus Bathyarchaeota archaeon]
MSAKLIELRNISKKYGYVYALRDVNLTIHYGEIFGLLGPNGSGKTTLLRILATQTSPTQGSVKIHGFDAATQGIEIRRRIGYIAHDSLLYKDLSGEENVKFYVQFYPHSSKQELHVRLDRTLRLLNITQWRHEPIKNLSAGLVKRFDLTRAILHNPLILLLDEPFSGLDIESVQILCRYLQQVRGNKTVFISTHNVEQARQLCDRIALLKKGRIQRICNASDVSNSNLLDLYKSV